MAGFTLLELSMTLILVAVLTAVAMPRFINTRLHVDEKGFTQDLLVAMRYAHMLAMDGGCEVRVVVDAATETFTVHHPDNSDADQSTCDGAGAGFGNNPVRRGSGKVLSGTAPSGVDITTGLSFFFNAEGKPYAAVGTPWTATGTAVVGSRTLSVEATTGYVH